jgi:hypothetical protein
MPFISPKNLLKDFVPDRQMKPKKESTLKSTHKLLLIFRYFCVKSLIIDQRTIFGWWLNLMQRHRNRIPHEMNSILPSPIFILMHHMISLSIQCEFRLNTRQLIYLGKKITGSLKDGPMLLS